MLYRQRRLEAERAAREAAGESFWAPDFPRQLRVQLLHHLDLLQVGDEIAHRARQRILIDEGIFHLQDPYLSTVEDFKAYVLNCEDDMMPSVVEAVVGAAGDQALIQQYMAWEVQGQLKDVVNRLLERHRVSFEFIEGEMVPMESRELHAEIVAPTLRLLARSDGRWQSVEKAYRASLDELARGKGADAITDAGTALQEALEVIGARGNSLGPLIKSARQKGLLAAHDQPMLDALVRLVEWVSADRSQMGDSHHADAAHTDDAWLTVHVVGALILRLSKDVSRSSEA